MAIDLAFRRRAVRQLTNDIGCYVLCDLDEVPLYVGQSVDGIRSRVNRHLTSARSDIIANRQIDVWKIAWVWAYPVTHRSAIGKLEDALFHEFDGKSALMNGKVPKQSNHVLELPKPSQRIQVMSDEEITEKRDPALRLPRQAEHYSQIIGHFLAVKNSKEIAGAIQAHFERLRRYHNTLLG
ncbi:MAG: GIY-YIG nuclease family protein [Dokdonella sp.]